MASEINVYFHRNFDWNKQLILSFDKLQLSDKQLNAYSSKRMNDSQKRYTQIVKITT